MDLQIRGFGEMNIGGQERPFHLGTLQARAYCEAAKVELGAYHEAIAAIGDGKGLEASLIIETLVYSALVAGAKFKKLPIDFDTDDVSFWIAGAEPGEVTKLFIVASELAKTGAAPGNEPGK